MRQKLGNLVVSAYGWLIRRPSYMLLTARDERLSRQPPQRFARAWVGVMILSLLWGVMNTLIWGWAWKVFRDYGLLIMPTLATLGFIVLWPGRRGVGALAEVLAGRDTALRSTIAVLVVLTLGFGFLALHLQTDWYGNEYSLPGSVSWLRPEAKLYRVLALMPLWGGWSMLIVCQFCKPTAASPGAVSAFARGCGAFAAAACLALPLGGSLFYFSFLPWTQLFISGAAVCAAIVGGLLICGLNGGLNRRNLLATNVLTQIVFVLAYLANR